MNKFFEDKHVLTCNREQINYAFYYFRKRPEGKTLLKRLLILFRRKLTALCYPSRKKKDSPAYNKKNAIKTDITDNLKIIADENCPKDTVIFTTLSKQEILNEKKKAMSELAKKFLIVKLNNEEDHNDSI